MVEKIPGKFCGKTYGKCGVKPLDPLRANNEYLTNIFDVFAPDFEQVLSGLDYQAPELISQMFGTDLSGEKEPRTADSGCRTRHWILWCFLQNYSRIFGLYGVDISEKC